MINFLSRLNNSEKANKSEPRGAPKMISAAERIKPNYIHQHSNFEQPLEHFETQSANLAEVESILSAEKNAAKNSGQNLFGNLVNFDNSISFEEFIGDDFRNDFGDDFKDDFIHEFNEKLYGLNGGIDLLPNAVKDDVKNKNKQYKINFPKHNNTLHNFTKLSRRQNIPKYIPESGVLDFKPLRKIMPQNWLYSNIISNLEKPFDDNLNLKQNDNNSKTKNFNIKMVENKIKIDKEDTKNKNTIFQYNENNGDLKNGGKENKENQKTEISEIPKISENDKKDKEKNEEENEESEENNEKEKKRKQKIKFSLAFTSSLAECNIAPSEETILEKSPIKIIKPVEKVRSSPSEKQLHKTTFTPNPTQRFIPFNKDRRKQTTRACVNCVIAKSGCDKNRPCRRCIRLNKPTCIDRKLNPKSRRKPKKVKKSNISQFSNDNSFISKFKKLKLYSNFNKENEKIQFLKEKWHFISKNPNFQNILNKSLFASIIYCNTPNFSKDAIKSFLLSETPFLPLLKFRPILAGNPLAQQIDQRKGLIKISFNKATKLSVKNFENYQKIDQNGKKIDQNYQKNDKNDQNFQNFQNLQKIDKNQSNNENNQKFQKLKNFQKNEKNDQNFQKNEKNDQNFQKIDKNSQKEFKSIQEEIVLLQINDFARDLFSMSKQSLASSLLTGLGEIVSQKSWPDLFDAILGQISGQNSAGKVKLTLIDFYGVNFDCMVDFKVNLGGVKNSEEKNNAKKTAESKKKNNFWNFVVELRPLN